MESLALEVSDRLDIVGQRAEGEKPPRSSPRGGAIVLRRLELTRRVLARRDWRTTSDPVRSTVAPAKPKPRPLQ